MISIIRPENGPAREFDARGKPTRSWRDRNFGKSAEALFHDPLQRRLSWGDSAFVDCLITGSAPLVTGTDGLEALVLAEAAGEGLRSGRQVSCQI